jgi:mono/diheme cytochrome c family protein
MLNRMREVLNWVFVAASAAALAGCSETGPPPFRLNMTNVVAKQISRDHQDAIANTLGGLFGTPDHPFALAETGLDQRKLDMAAGPVWSDKVGTKHGLYRRHCAHCHGISGDGHGPTALILDPYPRDYRPGIFKFKSTFSGSQPTDADLARIVHNGIPGSAMPSFSLLPHDEQLALVEYVKYLSMRGQMETALESFIAENVEPDAKFDPAENAEIRTAIIDQLLKPIVEAWQSAKDQVIVPTEDAIPADNRTPTQVAESAAKGRDLFFGPKANCVKCHGPTALGDGQQDDYDDWMKANLEFIKGTDQKVAEINGLKEDLAKASGEEAQKLKDQIRAAEKEYEERQALIAHMLPLRHAIPRNLRQGAMRGGNRPIDLYWRISAGIRGMPMPGLGPPVPGAQGTISEQEIWQIVDYVQSLPFEPSSQPQTRPPVNKEAVSTGG